MTDLPSLIARLEQAEGPSRELDWRIAEAFGVPYKGGASSNWPPFMPGSAFDKSIPHLTSSLDAAVALAERKFPTEQVLIGWKQTETTKPWARVGRWPDPDATGATPAIAVCIATLIATLKASAVQENRA